MLFFYTAKCFMKQASNEKFFIIFGLIAIFLKNILKGNRKSLIKNGQKIWWSKDYSDAFEYVPHNFFFFLFNFFSIIEAFGHASREVLRMLCIGKIVRHINIEKPADADQSYEIAILFHDEQDIGEQMLQRGWARCTDKASSK